MDQVLSLNLQLARKIPIFREKLSSYIIFDFKAIQISTIKNKNLYTFTYFSNPEHYDIFLPIAQKMRNSLKLQ